MKERFMVGVLALLVAAGSAVADEKAPEKEKVNWDKIKCPVSGKPVSKDAAVDYKKAKLYFCCLGCPDAFEKNKEKLAAKANHQLVATKQAKQKACPISGRPCNEDVSTKVLEVEVHFCCNGCRGKVDDAEDDAKLTLVFSEKAFEKGYQVEDKETKEGT